jgi:hypothetical protein
VALSVSKGVYRYISVETPQSIDASTGGGANLTLNTSLGDFVLHATATAAPAAAVGGGYPLWWPAYVRAELARQAAKRESLALQLDTIRILGPMPFVAGELEAEPARSAAMTAIMRMPRVEGEIFVPRVLTLVEHDEPVDDEALALLSAAMLLAA